MTTDSTAKRLWEWDAARAALLVALAWLPRTLSVAQCLIYFVVIPLWAVGLWRCGEWRKLRRDIFFWTAISFWLVAIVVSALGPRPEVTLAKTGRLAMILLIPAMAGLYGSGELRGWRRLQLPVVLFVAGCSVVAVINLWEMRDILARGERLMDHGTMRVPQLYLVAVCLLLGATAHSNWRRWWPVWGVALALNAVALVGNYKRGIWFGLVIGIVAMLVKMKRWRLLVGLTVAMLALLLIPSVQKRLGDLRNEFRPESGSRMVLWTEAMPSLVRTYPWGMGYSAIRIEDIEAHAPHLPAAEKGRLWHLHNSALQVLVEMSMVGLLVWLGWMGEALWMSARLVRCAGDDRWLAAGVFGALCGLLVVGMTENNFMTSYIFVVYMMLMGMTAALWARGAGR